MASMTDKSRREANVLMPPDQHIDVPAHELSDVLTGRLAQQDRETYKIVLKLFEGISQFEFLQTRRLIRKSFELFSTAALGHEMIQRVGKGVPKATEVVTRERKFISNFISLMDLARYQPLTKDEWETAQAVDFDLNMPVNVNWDVLDDRMLTGFWAEEDAPDAVERQADHARQHEHSNQMLIYHRGVGMNLLLSGVVHRCRGTCGVTVDSSRPTEACLQLMAEEASVVAGEEAGQARKEDVFMNEKVDLILEYTVLRLRSWVMAKLSKKKDKDEVAAEAAGSGSAQHAATMVQEHRNQQRVRRVTLYDHYPDLKTLLKGLYKRVEVVEPTYKRMVVLYRRKVRPPTKKEIRPNLYDEWRHRKNNIYIKSFDEVPLADLELILPDTSVSLKPLSKIVLLATIVGAFVTGLTMIWTVAADSAEKTLQRPAPSPTAKQQKTAAAVMGQQHAAASCRTVAKQTDISTSLIMSMMGVVAARCFSAWSSMQTEKAKMMQTMANKLYNKSLDSQEGVIFSIIQEMGEQFLSEVVLAYTLLLQHGALMSEEELDRACEDFLKDTFGMEIDFAIEASLPRLIGYGLVSQNREAQERLTQRWAHAFNYSEKDGETSPPGAGGASYGVGSAMKAMGQRFSTMRSSFRTTANSSSSDAWDAPAGADKVGSQKSKRSWFGSKDKAPAASIKEE